MPKKKKYDWKITLKKGIKQAIYIFIAGLGVVYGKSEWYLALVPLLNMLENWLKHR